MRKPKTPLAIPPLVTTLSASSRSPHAVSAVAAVILLVTVGLAGCAGPGPAPSPPGPVRPTAPAAGFNPIVKLETDFGDIYIEVFQEMAPKTAANFLRYAASRFYDGTRVDRVIGPLEHGPDGYLIQMGDPTTRNPLAPRESWGHGDPSLPKVPDEFNPSLRHDGPGVVAVARGVADSGTSQFYITLTAAPELDDVSTIFGRVVQGMDAVRSIGNVSVDANERPLGDVLVRATSVIQKQRDPAAVRHGLEAWGFHDRLNTTGNHTTQFGVVVRNTGNVVDNVNVTLQGTTWAHAAIQPLDFNVSAGASILVLFLLYAPPDAAPGDVPVRAVFRVLNATGVEASVPMTFHVGTLGAYPRDGQNVTVDYIGTLLDGRVFDTSVYRVASDPRVLKVANIFRLGPPAQYTPLSFPIGDPGLIRGFSSGARTTEEGEIHTVFMLPSSGYGEAVPANKARLAGRSLAFTFEMLKVEP